MQWSESDRKLLSKTVKNFNAKIGRITSKNPDAVSYLPDRTNIKQALEGIETRADFNSYIKSLQRFSKRGAEKATHLDDNLVVTKWESSEINYKTRRFNNAIKVIKTDVDLPKLKISKKDIIDISYSLEDFRKLSATLDEVRKPENLKTIKTTRSGSYLKIYETIFRVKEDIVNRIKAQELEKLNDLPVTVGGKDTGKTRAEMGTIKDNAIKPHKASFKNKSAKELKKAFEAMDAQLNKTYLTEKRELMRVNYLKGLSDNGFLGAVPELEGYIRELDVNTFYNTVMTDETATFYFYKDPASWEVRKEYLLDTWKTAYENEVD